MINLWKKGCLLALSQKRIILLYYLSSVFIFMLAIIPHMVLHKEFGSFSLLIQEGFDNVNYFFDLLAYESTAFTSANYSMMIGLILFIILYLLLSAGTLSQFKSGESYSSSIFWGGGFQWFGPFVRLGLWSLIYLIVLFICILLLIKLIEVMLGDDPYESWSYWLTCMKWGLITLALFFWRTLFEWGRVLMLANSEPCSRRIFIMVSKGFYKNKKLWGIVVINLVIGLVFLLAYILMKSMLGNSFVTLLIAQVYLLARITLRLANYAGLWMLSVSEVDTAISN